MRRCFGTLLAILCLGLNSVRADDGLGLKRGGNPSNVTISGLSSGAAMAVQYAVAHSSSIVGIGSVAGVGWDCADGSLSRALNDCLCGRHALKTKIDAARQMAASGKIDALVSGKPQALTRSYAFHSPVDMTVVKKSGQANIDFLNAFIGDEPTVDGGNPADGSDQAGHGIISPDGTDACRFDGNEKTYIRRCGAEDNAGKMFLALYDPGAAFDPSKRVNNIPDSEVWQFDQQHLIDQVKAGGSQVAPDESWFGWWPYRSSRRKNFDMAAKGYIYVPPSCRSSGSACRVHIALHGCKQNVRDFATRAGYNNWAEHYKTIVVYPAIAPNIPLPDASCQAPPVDGSLDSLSFEPNPNGCWDWWGYLDTAGQKDRYLTKAAPQTLVIERIIGEVTGR